MRWQRYVSTAAIVTHEPQLCCHSHCSKRQRDSSKGEMISWVTDGKGSYSSDGEAKSDKNCWRSTNRIICKQVVMPVIEKRTVEWDKHSITNHEIKDQSSQASCLLSDTAQYLVSRRPEVWLILTETATKEQEAPSSEGDFHGISKIWALEQTLPRPFAFLQQRKVFLWDIVIKQPDGHN